MLIISKDKNNKWRSGVRDLKGLSKKIKSHANSLKYIEACQLYDHWKQNRALNENTETLIRHKASFWKMVLERGHSEVLADEIYNGNFLSHVYLLSKYDDTMKQVLNKPKGTTNLSPAIQNELTQLKMYLEQLSLIFRYVHIIRKQDTQPCQLAIKETFFDFYEIKDHSAVGLTNQLLLLFENKGIDLKKCRGQGYDGANVMSGIYNGVQKKINNIQPSAQYVYCASHNLNLVINDAVSGCREVNNFFIILQEIYSFFSNSIRRWDLLSNFNGESEVTFKKLNPTRWSSRINSLLAIKLRFLDIVKTLTEISLKYLKRVEQTEALKLRDKVSNFEFVFICFVMYHILTNVNYASKNLQKKYIDLYEAATLFGTLKFKLKDFRSNYDLFKLETFTICSKWKIKPTFKVKRQSKYARRFDDLSGSDLNECAEKIFQIVVFYRTIDIVNVQISDRFTGIEKLSNLFNFLQLQNFIKLSEDDLIKSVKLLQHSYPDDLTKQFPAQLINAITFIKNDITEARTLKDIADILLIKYSFMECDFSDVNTPILLLMTIPVTVASAERSFSKLKIIKSYLRNCMSQERLKHCAILAIETEKAQTLELDKFYEIFLNLQQFKNIIVNEVTCLGMNQSKE
ncbi:zinc finger MYM-type protein 1-like [Hydra vulgaris]|uniref:Zinc finger MYM-type protein 1-like n=1 Tax=Hydra vulgaris TaxID=6087 RepID=A0ABM4CM33_HYDVU